MKKQILGILAIVLVVLAFSGIASSDTSRMKLVTPEIPAWNETVLVSEAWNESILVSPAWNETVPAVTHTVPELVSAAYWVWNCDIYDWIDAVYQNVVIVDVPEVPAWDELITPAVPEVPAWDELISEEVPAWDELISDEVPAYDEQIGVKEFSNRNGAEGWGQAKVNSGFADSYTVTKETRYNHCFPYNVYVVKIFEHHDAIPADYEHHDAIAAKYLHHDAIPAVPAEYLHHDAVPAQTHVESRLVSEGHYQYLGHMDVQTAPNGYTEMISQCSAAYPGWNMICHPHTEVAAVYKDVVVVDEPENVIEHSAVFNIVEHAAVFEVIEHALVPAVWEIITTGDVIVDDNGVQKMVDEAGNLVPTGNIVNTNPTFCSA